MLSAFVISLVLEFGFNLRSDSAYDFAHLVLLTAGGDDDRLVDRHVPDETRTGRDSGAFLSAVRPSARMWGPIAAIVTDVTPQKDDLVNLSNWALGCLLIYMALFGFGKLIFGEYLLGSVFLCIAAICFTMTTEISRSTAGSHWDPSAGTRKPARLRTPVGPLWCTGEARPGICD